MNCANTESSAVGSGVYNVYGMGGDFAREGSARPLASTSWRLQERCKKTGSQAPSGDVATDYSKTNIQVEGVDEADFVKNDDKYVYVSRRTNL